MYTMAIGPPTCRGDDGGMHILWPEGEVGTGTGRAFTARLPQRSVCHMMISLLVQRRHGACRAASGYMLEVESR